MANYSPKTEHLISTQWQPGKSGNEAGKPRGSVNLSTWIQHLMLDDNFEIKLKDGSTYKGAPIRAIVATAIVKAMEGDLRAFDLLGKYGYGSKVDVTSKGKELPVPIMGGLSLGSSDSSR